MSLSKPLINALSFYFGQLYEHPIRTKSISSFVIATLGNYVSQKIGGSKTLDYQNLAAYGIFGILFGGTIPHYFYLFMERAVPEEASFVIAKKLILERLIYSPLFLAFALYTIARLEGKSHETALKQFQTLYWAILTSSWKYLTVLQLFNFTLVPPMLRVLVVNLIGFFWTVYVSSQRRKHQAKSKSA